jgi:hypothetical protein
MIHAVFDAITLPMDLSRWKRDLRDFILKLCYFFNHLQGFLRFFFIHEADRKTDVDQGVVAHFRFGGVCEAYFLDDPAEVNLCHGQGIFLVDVGDFAGDGEAHINSLVIARAIARSNPRLYREIASSLTIVRPSQ